MAVKYKYFIPNQTYFITFTILGWTKIFTNDKYCGLVYKWFDYMRENYGNKIYGYVIMPNHIHALIHTTDKAPKLSIFIANAKRFLAYQIIAFLEEDDKKEIAINTFTEKYLSHGYPIDRNKCKEVLSYVICPDSDIENKICELHEIYEDLLMMVHRWNTQSSFEEDETEIKPDMEEGLFIVQVGDNKCVVVNGEDITAQL